MAVNPWPLPIRLIHWLLVALITTDILFLEPGEWVHKYAGYTMAGLVCIRLGLLCFSRNRAYAVHLPTRAAIKQQISQRQWAHPHHSPLGTLMIYCTWCLLLTAAGTGHLQTTDVFWGDEWVELLHSTVVYSLFAVISLHICAILLLHCYFKVPLLARMWRG
jgi:cytochrome b